MIGIFSRPPSRNSCLIRGRCMNDIASFNQRMYSATSVSRFDEYAILRGHLGPRRLCKMDGHFKEFF
jgi:hypothetical protein